MVSTDDPYRLLLRHFSSWAESKRRSVDLDLLAELIRLRESYDDLDPAYWPRGSVEHLLLERWPSKGEVGAPDEAMVVETLDGWFRFLRSTGRMSGRSGEPQELTKEARRAAKQMVDVAGDRAHWSSTKVLMEFGRSVGIDLDNVADAETMQDRLDQVTQAWNSLPDAERRRLMPDPSGRGGRPDADVSGRELVMARYGTDDPIVGLLMSFSDRLPTGELPPADIAAPQFRHAPFVQQLLALAEWARDGQPVTDTDVLRLAPSREVYELLGLDAVTRGQLERSYPDDSLPGVARVGRGRWIEDRASTRWRSAAECEPIDRLWFAGFPSGRLRLEGRKVFGTPDVPADAEGWLMLGIAACSGLMDWLGVAGERLPVIVQALLSSYVGGRAPVPKEELVDFYRSWILPASYPGSAASPHWKSSVNAAIGWIADTGLVIETDDSVRLTEAGDVFVSWWLQHMATSPPR